MCVRTYTYIDCTVCPPNGMYTRSIPLSLLVRATKVMCANCIVSKWTCVCSDLQGLQTKRRYMHTYDNLSVCVVCVCAGGG